MLLLAKLKGGSVLTITGAATVAINGAAWAIAGAATVAIVGGVTGAVVVASTGVRAAHACTVFVALTGVRAAHACTAYGANAMSSLFCWTLVLRSTSFGASSGWYHKRSLQSHGKFLVHSC